jgi:hypothetical protein
MTRLRNSPRLHRGAIVAIDPKMPIPTVIAFQYNPSTMSRKLTPTMSKEGGGNSEVQRVDRAPTEKITLKAEFDATDGLEVRDPIATRLGIYPQLSALEILLYPPKSEVIRNLFLKQVGTTEVIPALAPLTLFVWGPKRVLPVRIEGLGIEETAYDERLNPIQASVNLDLRVLSDGEFSFKDPGGFIFLAHHAIKEALALTGTAKSIVSFF